MYTQIIHVQNHGSCCSSAVPVYPCIAATILFCPHSKLRKIMFVLGEMGQVSRNGRSSAVTLSKALSCWYWCHLTGGSAALPPPSGVLGLQHSTCSIIYSFNMSPTVHIDCRIQKCFARFEAVLWNMLQPPPATIRNYFPTSYGIT